MGLLGKSKNAIDFDDIASVIIMEQTNLFKNQSNWGATFGSNILDGDAFVTNQCVPAGTEIKFSVTYKNGKKEIVKAMSGSAICDRLLQMAIDPPVVNSGPTGDNIEKVTDDYKPFKIEKNQIPTGTYIIGEDIPEGIYDFTWVFGAGTIKLLQVAEDNTISNMDYFQWVGNKQDYEYRQCFHVECKQGKILSIEGNLVVSIAKSKKIELDL